MWPVLLVDGAKKPTGWVDHWSFNDLVNRLTYLRNAKQKLEAPGWLPVRIKAEAQKPELRFYPDPNAPTWTQKESGRMLAKRRASSIEAVWALVVDIDQGFPIIDSAELQRLHDQPAGIRQMASLIEQLEALSHFAVSHTTWSHTDHALKARVVFPFAKECPAERWPDVWKAGARWAESWGAKVDPACKDPSRLYFLPAAPFDRPIEGMHPDDVRRWLSDTFSHSVVEKGCDWLSWHWLLSQYPEPEPPKTRARPKPKTSGMDGRRLDGAQAQRRRFALAFLERRVKRTAEAPAGARNQTLYGNARACGRHVVAGMLTEQEVSTQLAWAGVAAGLAASEVQQAIDNGLAKAREDGPWIY